METYASQWNKDKWKSDWNCKNERDIRLLFIQNSSKLIKDDFCHSRCKTIL